MRFNLGGSNAYLQHLHSGAIKADTRTHLASREGSIDITNNMVYGIDKTIPIKTLSLEIYLKASVQSAT